MKCKCICIEIVRLIAAGEIQITETGASPAEKIRPIIKDLRRYKEFLQGLARGHKRVGKYSRGVRLIRLACDDVLEAGHCLHCLDCKEWAAESTIEGLTGTCISRTEIQDEGQASLSTAKGSETRC